jgi:hypothetical protein
VSQRSCSEGAFSRVAVDPDHPVIHIHCERGSLAPCMPCAMPMIRNLCEPSLKDCLRLINQLAGYSRIFEQVVRISSMEEYDFAAGSNPAFTNMGQKPCETLGCIDRSQQYGVQ